MTRFHVSTGGLPGQITYGNIGHDLHSLQLPRVRDASPGFGSTNGGSALHIVANFDTRASIYACHVGSVGNIAVRWSSLHEVECITPARNRGQAYVHMSAVQFLEAWNGLFLYRDEIEHCDESEICVDEPSDNENRIGMRLRSPNEAEAVTTSDTGHQTAPMQIMSFFPPTIASRGGVVTVYGSGIFQTGFGYQGTLAYQVVSSALMRMEVGGGAPGEYFSPSVMLSTSDSKNMGFMYEVEAMVISVQPTRGTVDGGTVMSVAGESFANSLRLSCSIGTVTPIGGRWVDGHMMECISPAHKQTSLPVSVTNGSPALHRTSITFTYVIASMVSSSSTVEDLGFVSEMHLPDSHATSGLQAGGTMAIHRGLSPVGITQIDQVMCRSAALIATEIDVKSLGREAGGAFWYIPRTLVRSITPMYMEAGFHHPVKIFGKEFSAASAFCMMNGKVVDALILSSAMGICELPDDADGDVDVVLGRYQGPSNVGTVTFFRQMRVVEAVPSSGPEAGGTLVDVKTLFDQRSPSQCRFGTTGPVPTRATSTGYQCTSPARHCSPAELIVHLPFTSFLYNPLSMQFHYVQLPLHLYPIPAATVLRNVSVQLFSLESCTAIASYCDQLSKHHICFFEGFLPFLRTSGFHAVKICNYFDLDVEIMQQSTIGHIYPRMAASSSPHVFHVYGSDFARDDSAILIASHHTQCTFQSSSILTCTTISNASSRGEMWHRLSLDDSDISLDTFDINLRSLEETRGVYVGGTVITLFGTFHAENLATSCRFGTIAPISTSHVTYNVAKCISPAHAIGVVSVSVGFHGDGYVLGSQEYEYTLTCAVQGITPSQGFTRRKLTLDLHEANCGSDNSPCEMFRMNSTFPHPLANNFRCDGVAGMPNILTWETFIVNDFDLADAVYVEYAHPIQLKSLMPKDGSSRGGTMVTLSGIALIKDGLGCEFDGSFVSGVSISSALFACESPTAHGKHAPTSAVTISQATNTVTDDMLELRLISALEVESIFPFKGGHEGGTIVDVGIQDTPTTLSMRISVGNIQSVAFRFVEGKFLDFVSPAHRPQRTIVKISMSASDYRGAGQVFEYVNARSLCMHLQTNARRSKSKVAMGMDCNAEIHRSCIDADAPDVLNGYFVNDKFNRMRLRSPNEAEAVTTSDTGHQTAPMQIMSFFPPTIASRGGVVTVYGSGIFQTGFGYQGTLAYQVVSSALMRMEVGGGAPGEYFSPSVMLSTSDSKNMGFMYEVEAMVISVQPTRGTVDGGTVMSVAGESFANSLRLSCSIGTVTPIGGRWVDGHMMECISPAHKQTSLPVSVTNGSPALHRTSITFTYVIASMVSSSSTVEDLGFVSEMHLPDSHATSGLQAGGTMAIHRGLSPVGITQIDQVMCRSAALIATEIDVKSLGREAGGAFWYIPRTLVRSITPMYMEAGFHHPVKIFGKEFSAASAFCMMNGKVVDALILSSAMGICELPDDADGDVDVVLGRYQGPSNVGTVTFFRQMRVVEAVPSSGPEAGGTLVDVKTLFDQRSPSQCRFGTTGPVPTRATSTGYQCTSPARRASTTSLDILIRFSFPGAHVPFSFFGLPLAVEYMFPTKRTFQTCAFSGSGADNKFRGTNVLIYNHARDALCKTGMGVTGFMALFIIPDRTFNPYTQFSPLDVAITQGPFVHSMHPTLGFAGGGTISQLSGENMVENDWNQLNCRFGNETQQAHIVSSSVSFCEAPANVQFMSGYVGVELSHEVPALVVGPKEVMRFIYVDSPSLEHIHPERGPSRGGTALHIHGIKFPNTQDLSCKFGNMHVRATFVSEQEILCLTPSHANGGVAVNVATNGRDMTLNALSFSFLS